MMVQEVFVLGGYGRLGGLCVSELLETTRARIVIAGPSVQRAERAALEHGVRVAGAYASASDPRTLEECVPAADAVIACSTDPPLAALECAVESRVPFISLTPLELAASTRARLAERAWEAQTPIILNAGVSPGLPGVVADLLVRRFDALHELRITCSGRPDATPPEHGVWKTRLRELRQSLGTPRRLGVPLTGELGAPVGRRILVRAHTPDLEGFESGHCVSRVVYLEPEAGLLGSGLDRLLSQHPITSFALIGEAFVERRDVTPAARIAIRAADAATAAASVAAVLTRAVLAGKTPAGLLSAREALNPGTLLDLLAKRGLEIETEGL
jgi:hypothetical protein